MMPFFVDFLDTAFLRLLWSLFVDYLVSSGFLMPGQRQIWVDGYAHILGVAGAILFTGIWLHHSNKKDQIKATVSDTIDSIDAIAKDPMRVRLIKFLLSKITVKEQTSETPQQ